MNENSVIRLDHVTMKYNLSKDRVDSIKEYVIKLMKRQLFYDEFIAVKDVSLEISKGEVFGLVGLNGAGKSTLLKLVAGVIKPTSGIVSAKGTIAPLIELGAGFDSELTARENVYMNGAVMGYSVKYMKERFEQIIDFAELWEFVDVPIKNFSSGMHARLGFSVATIVKPEILIVDEILGVGDYKFQQKCNDRIKELMGDGTTVLMVSHSSDQIKEYCDRAAWLEKGELIDVGPAREICDRYLSIQ
ncbi:ABC transporter ATP-binding protein [Lacrimispora sp.]|uniref:ABC transporter ATP-binding protein n=1 Tax=Lacrimispora sp. TaxID=2719234 RepID=UPI0028974D9E|nr:ABC transporter ATP-binding protein [Lacrimispora sp.]